MSSELRRDIETKSTLDDFDIKLKIVVLGESMVGKTSFITRFTNDKFGGRYLCTVGIDYQKKIIEKNGKKVLLQIWDTAGQERFRNVTKNYFKASQGFILAYDINNKESFERVQYWVEEIKSNAEENIKCILIGTKCDLDKREVSEEEGQNFGKQYGYKFLETSAKENININETFDTLISEIMDNFTENGRQSIKIPENKIKKKKKKCC